MNATQQQRNYITSLLTRIGVETTFKAGALTIDQAKNAGVTGGFRTPREVAQHSNTKTKASATITALLAITK